MARLEVTEGDLLDQDVQVIVNAWNRNVIPWWLLIPQGVSQAIKRVAGSSPFRELARHGAIPLGAAVMTGPGRSRFQAIIHVAGINLIWRSSEFSIRQSVRSALDIASNHQFASVAFPLIGAGSGGTSEANALTWMTEAIQAHDYSGKIIVVRYRRS